MSRDVKARNRWENYIDMQKDQLWFNDDLQEEKQKVMLTFEEARECRFQPMVGLRAP